VERRRAPPPWSIEEHSDACFIVKDRNGRALAYVYFEEEPGRRAAANLLTCGARRIAANEAKLPELLRKRGGERWAARLGRIGEGTYQQNVACLRPRCGESLSVVIVGLLQGMVLRHISQERAMAKAKTATRKKGSKRGKTSAKPARKAAAKRTTAKKAKSKVRRAGRGAPTFMTKKQRPPKAAASEAPKKTPKQVVEAPIEDTIIDVTEEPVPGAVDATEDETIQAACDLRGYGFRARG
jgi:hypothetical protein